MLSFADSFRKIYADRFPDNYAGNATHGSITSGALWVWYDAAIHSHGCIHEWEIGTNASHFYYGVKLYCHQVIKSDTQR